MLHVPPAAAAAVAAESGKEAASPTRPPNSCCRLCHVHFTTFPVLQSKDVARGVIQSLDSLCHVKFTRSSQHIVASLASTSQVNDRVLQRRTGCQALNRDRPIKHV